jgi:hypothetical protein
MPEDNYDWIKEIFEGVPDIGFFTQLGSQTKQGSPQRRYFQNKFNPILSEFKGVLGQQLQSGELPLTENPESRFFDYLSNNPFAERFQRMAPMQRGQGQARFNMPTKFFF